MGIRGKLVQNEIGKIEIDTKGIGIKGKLVQKKSEGESVPKENGTNE